MNTVLSCAAAWWVLGSATLAWGQYAGPAIISRGEAPTAMITPDITFRPSVTVGMVYDSGLSGVSVNGAGQLPNDQSLGMYVGWSVSGAHSWKRTHIGMSYQGSMYGLYRHSSYDSLNQSISLGLSHEFTPHIIFTMAESAGMFSLPFGTNGLQQTVPFDPNTLAVPTTDYFDNRTYYFESRAGLTIQKSARLSFQMAGLDYLTLRRSSALYGSLGTSAYGDVQYRLTRYVTVGAAYQFVNYSTLGVQATTDAHTGNGVVSLALSRHTELSGMAGVSRIESKFVQTVTVDPVIAALLGTPSSSVVVHSIRYQPSVAARISRVIHHGVLFANVGHGLSPGNGLFLSSNVTTIGGGYYYTGLRRWSASLTGYYSQAGSFQNYIGTYDDAIVSVAVSRTLGRYLHFVSSYGLHHYTSPTFADYNRTVQSALVGLAFSPGDLPLRLW